MSPRAKKTLLWAPSSIAAIILVAYSYLHIYPSYNFHPTVAAAVIMAIAPAAVYYHVDARRKRMIDDSLPTLLDTIAESQETGLTLMQAMEEAAKRRRGPLYEELRRAVAKMTWGVEFDKALESLVERTGTELVEKVAVLISQAVRLGGDLKTVFKATGKFVREVLEMRRERESQLRPYFTVIYVATAIFMIVVVILYQSLFIPMSEQAGEGAFLKIPLTAEQYKGLLFDVTLIETFFSGIIAGKLSEGKVVAGLKHSIILIASAAFVFTFFLL